MTHDTESPDAPGGLSPLRARLGRGMGATTYGLVLLVVMQLVSVPILTRQLGVPLYGEWLVLSAVPAYLALSDLGFVGAASNDMTAAMARGERQLARDVLRTVWALLTVLSLLLLLTAVVATSAIDLQALLHLQRVTGDEARTTVLLLVGWTLLVVQNSVLEACWRAQGRYATGTALSATFRFIDFVAAVTAALFTAELEAIAAGQLATRLATLAMNYVLVTRANHELTLGLRGVSTRHARRLTSPALSYMLFPIGNAIALQGMVLVVGVTLGAVAVVVVTATRTLANLLKQLLQLPGHATWPELTRALSHGDQVTALRLSGVLRDLAVWTGAALPLLVLAAPSVIAVWAGESARPTFGFVAALACVTWLECLWWSLSLAPLSVNRHQQLAAAYAVSCVSGVAVAVVTVGPLGLYAVPLGLLLPHGVSLVVTLRICRRTLGVSRSVLLRPNRPASLWQQAIGGRKRRGDEPADR